jgi:NADH dehydrogenase (ubiquinone) flavoprotein 1
MRHFRPEVEARLAAFHAKNGQVLYGGKLLSEVDERFAIPDNLGGGAYRQIASV